MKRRHMALILSVLCFAQCLFAGCAEKDPLPVETTNSTTNQSQLDSATEVENADGAESTVVNDATDEDETDTDMNDIPALRDCVPAVLDCRIGCAVTSNEIEDPKVWEIITKHFNSVTFGNELKPDCLFGYSNSKCPGTEEVEFNGQTITVPKMTFKTAEKMLDKIYDYNEANPDRKIEVRGHVLLWHSQTPEWFFHEDYDKSKDYVDKETMNVRLEWYIKTVLTHFTGEDSKYKDMFYGWDVVNEAISDSTGELRTDSENESEKLSQDTHGSNSSWYHIYGSNEFIINAFIYWHK